MKAKELIILAKYFYKYAIDLSDVEIFINEIGDYFSRKNLLLGF